LVPTKATNAAVDGSDDEAVLQRVDEELVLESRVIPAGAEAGKRQARRRRRVERETATTTTTGANRKATTIATQSQEKTFARVIARSGR
jgi:short subunit dehydrogenase-like uncharacterized protein